MELISAKDLAVELGKHPQVLADWRHQGRGPDFVRIGRSIRYHRADIERWLEENTVRQGGDR